MTKKRRQQQNAVRDASSMIMTITKKRIITYGIMVAILYGVGIVGYKSMISTNGNAPVFGLPINHFVKAKYSPGSGYTWVSMPSSSSKELKSLSRGKGAAAASPVNPSYVLGKGGLQSMHIVNAGYETHSKHSFNIDEFNAHFKDLTYTQSQTVTFVADKSGTFHYYCSIHPEMKGDIII